MMSDTETITALEEKLAALAQQMDGDPPPRIDLLNTLAAPLSDIDGNRAYALAEEMHAQAREPGGVHPGADQLWRVGRGGGGAPGRRARLPAQGLLARRPLRRRPQRTPGAPVTVPGTATELLQPQAPPPTGSHFTAHELDVLHLLVQGKSNLEIGQAWFISPTTVRYHVTCILTKLNVANRTQAAVVAQELHLV